VTDSGQLLAALLAGAAALALIGWLTPLPRFAMTLAVAMLGAAWLVSALSDDLALSDGERVAVVAGAGLLALAGGGPLTTVVFDLVDRPGESVTTSLAGAAEVLRGGAWIGALERIAAYAAVLAGWPEGLAIVLALKGLGRYPELRAPEGATKDGRIGHPAATERFFIGTFTSVLWALACAGVVVLSI
jgi:hypothetical protein